MTTETPAKAFRRQAPFRIWLLRHIQMMISSLGRLSRNPLATFMTVAVMGIALALPAGLHVLVDRTRHLAGQLEGSASLSLFLHTDQTDEGAERLAKELQANPQIAEIRVVTRQEAMAEFRELSGFGGALDLLEENPLPAVLIIHPTPAHSDALNVEQLATILKQRPEVELVQVDLEWVQRLQAMTGLLERAVLLLAVLFASAVLLVVGNTVRLEILNRREEIEIAKLVGATDAFIRRPFLYDGLWYGLLSGLMALGLLVTSLGLLAGPVEELAGLYQSAFRLHALPQAESLYLLTGGALLGLGGAWIAVGRHLRAIEPS